MRALLISALAATLTCCTCLPRSVQIADQGIETPVYFWVENGNSALATKTLNPSSTRIGKKTNQVASKATYTVAGKMIPLPSAQQNDHGDPVIEKVRATIAAMMEDPASSTFGEMKRVVTNLLGEPIEAICGYVRGKNASGGDTGEIPFVFIVPNDEAYIVDGNSTTAATAHRNLCH